MIESMLELDVGLEVSVIGLPRGLFPGSACNPLSSLKA